MIYFEGFDLEIFKIKPKFVYNPSSKKAFDKYTYHIKFVNIDENRDTVIFEYDGDEYDYEIAIFNNKVGLIGEYSTIYRILYSWQTLMNSIYTIIANAISRETKISLESTSIYDKMSDEEIDELCMYSDYVLERHLTDRKPLNIEMMLIFFLNSKHIEYSKKTSYHVRRNIGHAHLLTLKDRFFMSPKDQIETICHDSTMFYFTYIGKANMQDTSPSTEKADLLMNRDFVSKFSCRTKSKDGFPNMLMVYGYEGNSICPVHEDTQYVHLCLSAILRCETVYVYNDCLSHYFPNIEVCL